MSQRKKWLIGFGVWTLLGLLAVSQRIGFYLYIDRPFALPQTIGRTMLSWYTCAVFTPAIFAIARRFRLDGPRWPQALPVHVAAWIGFIAGKLALFIPIMALLGWLNEPVVITQWIFEEAFPLTIAYASVVAAFYAIDYYERYRLLSRVQLDALRAQLHPHFLFNALNALSTLVHRDPQSADRMIIELGELLRQTLSETRAPEVTLQEELRLVERYIAIMQIRYGDRLSVHYDVDNSALGAYVPHMVLQPLVENALVHGIGRAAGEGSVIIRARRTGNDLALEIEDDGAGIQATPVERVGLGNTRALLEQLYASNQSLVIQSRNGKGVLVRVTVPYHVDPVFA